MPDDWKTYRTRFVIRAKQLTQPFTFIDINGREHLGQPGDYLIESSEGLRISRREIFEDVYVAMELPEEVLIPTVTEQGTNVESAVRNGEEHEAGAHVSGAYRPGGHESRAHGSIRAETGAAIIAALAPVQPPPEHANLAV
jgi:hypothetical protein